MPEHEPATRAPKVFADSRTIEVIATFIYLFITQGEKTGKTPDFDVGRRPELKFRSLFRFLTLGKEIFSILWLKRLKHG